MIGFETKGSFDKTKKFLKDIESFKKLQRKAKIDQLAAEGVIALEGATPRRTGLTASSWSYEIEESNGQLVISWNNSNVNNGVNIAVILQYGHGTKNGGYVVGIDYINPALRSIFDEMTDSMWKAVVSL